MTPHAGAFPGDTTAMNRKRTVTFLVRLGGLALLALAGHAAAAERPFDQAGFDRDRAAGRPVVVYFHADWCPTCKVQKPIVDRLAQAPALQPVTIYVADYDTETALEKSLNVHMQSTFVVFRRGREVARSTGQTQEAAIRAVLRQAL